jgi:hypothetical protein
MSGSTSDPTRRRFLLGAGALAGAAALAACGGGKDDEKTDGTSRGEDSTTSTTGRASKLVLAQFFGSGLFAAGQPLRAPFGVADSEGLLPVDKSPDHVQATILSPDGKQVGEAITVAKHAKGLQRAYYPLVATLPEPGIYTVRAELDDGPASEMALQVSAPGELTVIQPGAALPALETPTADDARGVNPICTASPACPLHDVTAAQALQEGTPIALLIATPAFCQVAICGPVLDVLRSAIPNHPGVKFLHVEVYADPAKSLDVYAPAVTQLGLSLEPVLVLVDGDGKVATRIDSIYDEAELGAELLKLS